MDYILIFFFFIILLVLVIFGLPIGRTSLNDEINDIEQEVIRENFESNVAAAPSTFYEWRDMTQNNFSPEIYSENETINSEDLYNNNYKYLETNKKDSTDDKNCLKCKNIDKYILKSSVPPCPDLTNYILKSEIPSSPDMNNYILKSNIPVCPTGPNMSDYIPKNQIPVCPTCPDMNNYMLKSKIPVCETCPTCPKEYKNIMENPKFKEWLAEYEKIVEDKINKNYISKRKCSKVVDQAYKNGEIEILKEIAQRFRDPNFLDFLKKKLGQYIKGSLEEEMGTGPNRGAPYQEEMGTGPNNNKNQKNQTSYNTTNMNNIYNKFNTNFDNNYKGVVKNNNNSNFADWNKSSLLLEEEYYKDIPNACNSF